MIKFTWLCPKCGEQNETAGEEAKCKKCGFVQKFGEKTKLFMQIFQKISELPKEDK